MFVAKYDAAGVHQWSHRYGSAAIYDYATDVALDGSDFVFTRQTTSFQRDVDFATMVSPNFISVREPEMIFAQPYDVQVRIAPVGSGSRLPQQR